jgi:glycosyltransferase involved in cell wall biosynthesis
MPYLSIITVCYNNLEGLKKTVESVIGQTKMDFEYIIIDGGSKDGTKEYLEGISSGITYWVSEPDLGIYNAMNKGISVANGEYLLFLNSGDHLYSPTVIENNYQYLKEHDLISFNLELIGESKSITVLPATLRFSDLYFRSLTHPSTFIKKELFKKVGLYDESLKIVSDWKFFIEALFIHRCTYKKIDTTLSTFYLDGISSRENFSNERRKVLQELYSGFITDYEEMVTHKATLNTKRFQMLTSIENVTVARKIVTVMLKVIMFLFAIKVKGNQK